MTVRYCQNPRCYMKDGSSRLRGTKGNKYYQNRTLGNRAFANNFCTLDCQNEWFDIFGDRAINYFGRIEESHTRPENSPSIWDIRYEVREGVDDTMKAEGTWNLHGEEWHTRYNELLDERIREYYNNNQQGDNNDARND